MVYDIVCIFAYVIFYINRYYRRDDDFGDAAVTAMAAFFMSIVYVTEGNGTLYICAMSRNASVPVT